MAKSGSRRKEVLDEFCKALGIYDREDNRRSYVAKALRAFGKEQCRIWLDQTDGDYKSWGKLANPARGLEIAKRKSKAREKELAELRYRDNVSPTVVHRDSQTELKRLRNQLEEELAKDDRASQFLLAGLRARIAELSAETGTPKM